MISDNKILLSHIDDLIAAVKKGRRCAFTPFLSLNQISDSISYLNSQAIDYSLFGGYDEAERCVIGFGSEGPPENYLFPVTALEFSLNTNVQLSHRNVLGSLMSLGIKRECLGDILFTQDRCVFFCETKIADFIQLNLTSVSNQRVNVTFSDSTDDLSCSLEEMFSIVTSMRLDCVVSELACKSRTYASELVEHGMVFIDGVQCQKKDKLVQPDNVISIRRIGKFKIDNIEGKTKKDRIKLKILKYI